MKNTLHLKKTVIRQETAQQPLAKNKLRPESSIIGKSVTVQGKSPSQFKGVVDSFEAGWLVLRGEERRWLPDGSLSEVVCTGRFTIERSAISYVCEVK